MAKRIKKISDNLPKVTEAGQSTLRKDSEEEPGSLPKIPRKSSDIIIRGARVHNLKNVNLTLPRNKLVVFTGVSGSGKSSLAFDTIYAEGQRRYVESLSS